MEIPQITQTPPPFNTEEQDRKQIRAIMDSLETTFTNYQMSFPKDKQQIVRRNMIWGLPALFFTFILPNPIYFYMILTVIGLVVKAVKAFVRIYRIRYYLPGAVNETLNEARKVLLNEARKVLLNEPPPINIAYDKLKNYRQYPDVAAYISSYRKKLRALEDEKERLGKINSAIIILFVVASSLGWLLKL